MAVSPNKEDTAAGRGEIGAQITGQSADQPRLADHGFAATLNDLLQEPFEILLGLRIGGQGVDGVFDRNGTDSLQSAPDLHAKIGRLGRQLMNQQQPSLLHRSRFSSCLPLNHMYTVSLNFVFATLVSFYV